MRSKNVPRDEAVSHKYKIPFIRASMDLISESEILVTAYERVSKILDAHYEKAKIDEYVETLIHLNEFEKRKIK